MRCRSCNEDKPLSDFHASSGRTCKACRRAQVVARTRENPAVQAYDRERAKTPERRARARIITIEWRKKYPERYKAETAVNNALRDGRLEKRPCEVCGRLNVHGHHEDYSKPLEVRWLCALHHHRHHADQRGVQAVGSVIGNEKSVSTPASNRGDARSCNGSFPSYV